MNLNQDFKEFVALLNANSVRYLVVGGYAVSFHGHPRYTKDIDIWIENEDGNADRILKSLDEFGFGSLGIEKEDLLLEDRILQLGHPPCRIDIITSLWGVSFKDCHSDRATSEVDGTKIDFIGRKALIANKLATARPQDIADAAHDK